MSDLNDFFSDDKDDIWDKPDMSEWSKEDDNGSDLDLFSNQDNNTDTENQNNTDDTWSDNVENQDDAWSDNAENQDDTWSDTETSSDSEASTSDADDSWMENSEQDDPWSDENWEVTDNEQSNQKSANDWGNDEINTGQEQKEIKFKNFSFNYKQASLIIAGICVFLALIVFGMSKIHFVSNTQQQQNVSKEASDVESNATGSKALKYVPNTTNLNYDSNVITSSGKVTKKDKYLLGQQLIYDAVIEIPAGTDTISLHYYCSRDVFEQLYENTAVTVDYQVASDNYYSIKSVKTQ